MTGSGQHALKRALADDEFCVLARSFADLRDQLIARLDCAESGMAAPDGARRCGFECIEARRLQGSASEKHRGYMAAKFRSGVFVVQLKMLHEDSVGLMRFEMHSSGVEPIAVSDVDRIGFSWIAKNPLFWWSLALLRESSVVMESTNA